MSQPASSPFLSKQRTRIVPYGQISSGAAYLATGDTQVVMAADVQTLAGDRNATPAAGKPTPGAVDWRLTLGSRLCLYGQAFSGAMEFRVNFAPNIQTTTPGWSQIAMFPLTNMPTCVELTVMAPYVRVDLGCLIAGSAWYSVTVRGPQ